MSNDLDSQIERTPFLRDLNSFQLVEALVSLANLCPNEIEREKLYSRAQKESGDYEIPWGDDDDSMDTSE